jgi:hypothetical protein
MTFTGHTTLFFCRSFCVVHCFIINVPEISVSSFLFYNLPVTTEVTSHIIHKRYIFLRHLKQSICDDRYFFHTCRKHKLYEQYILYYCTYVLVEIVFFILCYFVMNFADPGPEKESTLSMSKLIQHEQAIQNLSYKYTLFRPTNIFFYLFHFNSTCFMSN